VRLTRARLLTLLPLWAACTNTSNNAPPGHVVDAGQDADPRGVPYLWYAGGALSAYSRSQTLATNDDGPSWQVVPDRPVHNCHDLAFDGAGNLWTIPIDGDQILRLPASRLAAFAPVIPDLVLTSPGLMGPVSLVFDAAGNLWVLNFNGAGPSIASIVRFNNPRGLTGNQTVSPSLTITPGQGPDEAARFTQAGGIAFDAAGNLWLAAVANALRIDHAGTLAGQVTATPSAVVATGDAYGSLAFDGDGSLWVTAAKDGSTFALRFSEPAQLSGVVTPMPAARLQLAVPGATFVGGMAFDGDGGLWISTSAALVKLAHADALTGEESVTTTVVLGRASFPDLSSKVVIRPTPPGLPLYAP
jgi:sugar lactone lactonase YvrE